MKKLEIKPNRCAIYREFANPELQPAKWKALGNDWCATGTVEIYESSERVSSAK